MPTQSFTDAFAAVGPLATGEQWTVLNGTIVVSSEITSAVTDPARGTTYRPGSIFNINGGATVYVRGLTASNLINRDPGLYNPDFNVLAAGGSTWNYAAVTGGILNTAAAVTIKAAAGVGLRNYITGLGFFAEALGATTEIAIRDGAAGPVLWRSKIPLSGASYVHVNLPAPLKGSANTLLEVVTLTASVTGAVYFNSQGYAAA